MSSVVFGGNQSGRFLTKILLIVFCIQGRGLVNIITCDSNLCGIKHVCNEDLNFVSFYDSLNRLLRSKSSSVSLSLCIDFENHSFRYSNQAGTEQVEHCIEKQTEERQD